MKVDWRNKKTLTTLIICLISSWMGCVIYLFFHTPLYSGHAMLFFHDGSEANVANGDLLLREVVGSRELNSLDPNHEQLIFTNSYSLFYAAVMRTRAYVGCYEREWKGYHYYDEDAPVRLTSFTEHMERPYEFHVKNWDAQGAVVEGDGWSLRTVWNAPLITPEGDTLYFAPGQHLSEGLGRTLNFSIEDPDQTALTFRSRMGRSKLLSLQVQPVWQLSPHPGLSARFLKALIECYVERHLQYYTASLDSVRNLLDRQIEIAENELRAMEQQEWGYKQEHRAISLDIQEQLNKSGFFSMEQRREELREREKQLGAYLQTFEEEQILPRALPLLPIADPLGINNDIHTYNQERDVLYRLQRQASQDHPRIAMLEGALGDRLGSLRRRVEDMRYAAICEAEVLERRMEGYEQEMREIASSWSGVAPLIRERRIKGSLYSYLSYKREENDLLRKQVMAPVRLLNQVQPGGLATPTPLKVLGYGTLGALSVWLAWLLIPAFFDFRIHSGATVRRLVSVPVMADVPYIADPALRREGLAGLAYEVTRELKGSGKMLCVTSTTPGEGKTFLSVNLAHSLAALGKRVCLVGLDLRRPVMQTHFGLKGSRGVSDWLSPAVNPEIASKPIDNLFFVSEENPGLTVLPGGTVPPNPAELLQSERFGVMLEELRGRFDVVVLDTPPAEIVADTVLVSRYVDLSLYVVRVGMTDRHLLPIIDELSESGRLREIRVVVNNSTSTRNHGFYIGGEK